MKIEHFAYQVQDAAVVGEWYCRQLGFYIKREKDDPFPVRFLADESGQVMIEIYSNPAVPVPDYAAMDPLILHMAFICSEIPATVTRLTSEGAPLLSGPETTPDGDALAMLRDPWGFAVQLCARRTPMIDQGPD